MEHRLLARRIPDEYPTQETDEASKLAVRGCSKKLPTESGGQTSTSAPPEDYNNNSGAAAKKKATNAHKNAKFVVKPKGW